MSDPVMRMTALAGRPWVAPTFPPGALEHVIEDASRTATSPVMPGDSVIHSRRLSRTARESLARRRRRRRGDRQTPSSDSTPASDVARMGGEGAIAKDLLDPAEVSRQTIGGQCREESSSPPLPAHDSANESTSTGCGHIAGMDCRAIIGGLPSIEACRPCRAIKPRCPLDGWQRTGPPIRPDEVVRRSPRAAGARSRERRSVQRWPQRGSSAAGCRRRTKDDRQRLRPRRSGHRHRGERPNAGCRPGPA